MAATAVLLQATTPPDYHTVVSPTLEISKDTSVSIPVGILACQRDPLLLSLDTFVVHSSVSQPTPPPAGKKNKKAVLAPVLPEGPILQIVLHDTVIFPEGGGQPSDTGLIQTNVSGRIWEVLQAKRHGGISVNYVRVLEGVSTDDALLAFAPGSAVTVSLDQKGFERRQDHMSCHTSQHLLSALLETRLNLPTLSWSLTAWPTPCYVDLPRSMTLEEIQMIQNEVNRLVFEGRRVRIEVKELAEEHRKPAEKTDNNRDIGRGLPQDYTGGVHRVVIIDGVDKNPCCGTHLPSLHNLQMFLLPPGDIAARNASAPSRLYFVVGPRLIHHLSSSHSLLAETSSIMSCGPPQVPERVALSVAEKKRNEKRVDDLESQLAQFVAKDIQSEIASHTDSSRPFVKHVHRTEDSLGLLNSIANTFAEATTPHVIVLSSSPAAQNASSSTVVVVFGSDIAKVKEVGNGLKAKLNTKGGGQARWSGKFTGVWLDHREGVVVDEVLASV